MVSLKFNTLATIIGFLLAIPILATSVGDSDGAAHLTARDIIPEEYINQVLAYHGALAEQKKRTEWQKGKRTLSVLQKRVPDDNTCPHGSTWIARDCMPDAGERAWQDTCHHEGGDPFDVDGECAENHLCVDVNTDIGRYDPDGEPDFLHDIVCWPRTPPSQDMVTRRNKRKYESQYGYRFFVGESSTQDVSIPSYINNPDASVSGELVDIHKLSVLLPVGTLTANLRGLT
ncbi:hypothetical protein HRS9139_01235 [Pyrenophora teres f. teres]|nr:hypothetical protein HRS9139_01235 [Pyrenophora teres f. teres]